MKDLGEGYDLTKDVNLIRINSPRSSVGGPWKVVYKDLAARWAVVLMDWEGERTLGIRWFWSKGGFPLSRGHATWMVVPDGMIEGVLNMCHISPKDKEYVRKALIGDISDEELISERDKTLNNN